MTHKASIRRGYQWRLAALTVVTLAVGGWFVYDGLSNYPHRQMIQKKFQNVRQAHPDNWAQLWAPIAQRHGWPENPGTPLTSSDIFTQYCYAVPCLLFGVFAGIGYLRVAGRWIASDQRGLHTNTGKLVPWQEIRSVDKSRWDKKGIAIVHYQNGSDLGRITLDDWKYNPEPTAAILAQVEQALGQADPADDSAKPSPAPANPSQPSTT